MNSLHDANDARDEIEPGTPGFMICPTCGTEMNLRLDGPACFVCEDAKPAPKIPAGWDAIEADDTNPTDHATPYAPTPEDDAYLLGHGLVMAGEDPEAPAEWAGDLDRMVAFYRGATKARIELIEEAESERREWHAWLDGLDERPELDFNELVHAIGERAALAWGMAS